MATKKKIKAEKTERLNVGDKVTVVAPTIFDIKGRLSDLLMTGVITKTNPMDGWDYEVEFVGELTLDGKQPVKRRLYMEHQIATTSFERGVSTFDDDLYSSIVEYHRAVNNYNEAVTIINRMYKSMSGMSSASLIESRLNSIKEQSDMIPALKEALVDRRRKLAVSIRTLLSECPED